MHIAIDDTDITGFANLFAISVGFIAGSGVLQELRRRSVEKIEALLDEIYFLKESLHLSEKVMDAVDKRLGEIEQTSRLLVKRSAEYSNLAIIANWIGMIVPLYVLYIIGLGEVKVGLLIINILLTLSFGWGPAVYLIFKTLVGQLDTDLVRKLETVRSSIVAGS
jgi:hypothetical protein